MNKKKKKPKNGFPFVAYCCGKPMLKKRQNNYVYFKCANPDHGRWFAVSVDPSKQSYCSCDSGKSPLMTRDFGKFRLYGGCTFCYARYSIYKEGVQVAFEVQSPKANEVRQISAKGLASIWDYFGEPTPNVDINSVLAKGDLAEIVKTIHPNVNIRSRMSLEEAEPETISKSDVDEPPVEVSEEVTGRIATEHTELDARVIASRKELRVGEILDLEIELVNSGKATMLLDKIEEVIPEGFEIAEKPQTYRIEGHNINMRGRRLDPLKTEELKLVLKPRVQGTFALKPTILYLDENGKYKSHEVEPVTITVRELGIKGWLKGEK